MMPTEEALDKLVRGVGRRRSWVRTARCALWSLALGVLLVVGAVMVDAQLGLPTWGLVALDGMLVLFGLSALIRAIRAGWASRPSPTQIAQQIEQQLPPCLPASVLVNAVALARPQRAHVSDALRQQAVALGNRYAQGIAPRHVVAMTPVWRAIGALGLAWLLAGMFVGLVGVAWPGLPGQVVSRLLHPFAGHRPYTSVRFAITADPDPVAIHQPATIRVRLAGPDLPTQATLIWDDPKRPPAAMSRQPAEHPGHAITYELRLAQVPPQVQRFYIDTPRGASAWHPLDVDPSPRLKQAQVRYVYPPGTGWLSTDQLWTDDAGLGALQGTQATVRLASHVKLSPSRLVLRADDDAQPAVTIALKPDPHDPYQVVGTFAIQHAGAYDVHLTARTGQTRQVMAGPIHLHPDRPPQLHLDAPDALALPPDAALPITLHARDDIALDQLTLHAQRNPDAPWVITLPTPDAMPEQTKSTRVATTLSLPNLGAQPGDVIRYHAQLTDRRPSSANPIRTRTHRVHVLAQEHYQALQALQTQRAALAQALQSLGDDPLADRLAWLSQALSAYADDARSWPTALAGVRSPSADLRASLHAQAHSAQALAHQLQRMRQPGSASPRSRQALAQQIAAFTSDSHEASLALSQTRHHAPATSAFSHAASDPLSHVPWPYRQAAAAYFTRLAQDQHDDP